MHERGDTMRAVQARVLEVAVQGTLAQTLEELVHMVESVSTTGVLGSILLLDTDGEHLRHGAGPSLPPAYNEAIDGIMAGPGVGSCGTAVHTKEPVYVSDIGSDPLWADFRELALSHGLRACWSIPIISGDAAVLGTFAMYHREPREPNPGDLELVDFVVRTAALVIERKRSEERLRDSEEQLRLATDAAEVGLWDLDPQSNTLFWPPRVKAMFGIAADQPISMADFYARLHPDDAEATSAAFVAAVDPDQRAVYDVEYRTIGKEDKVVRWVAAKGRGVFDKDGRCTRVLGTAIDITARKATEQSLLDLNETLEQRVATALAERRIFAGIVEATDGAVLACDLEFGILAINTSTAAHMERVYGVRPKLGDNLLGVLTELPEHRDQIERHWGRALSGEEFTFIDEFGDAARERIHFEVRFHVLRDREGKRIGAFQTAYDVTDRIRAQAELETIQDALRQAQKMEAVGQLTGGVAHDFNNLLTVIRGSVDLLRRGDLTPERRDRYIDAIGDTADRAATLTGQLLAFSRRQALKPETFDVGASIGEAVNIVRTLTGSRIKVELRTPDNAIFALADRSQLDTAIVNMAINARDAMNSEGRLLIAIGAVSNIPAIRAHQAVAGDFVAVTVTDTGVGIPADRIERIFEPFFTTKGVGQGTGLGLSQVFGFAKQSGGDIQVESVEGRGTTFTLYLPRAYPGRIEAEGGEQEAQVDGDGLCVLVVEDNESVGAFAIEALKELGYDSILAPDGEAALAQLAKTADRFHIVFSDVVMPGMGGLELAATVRRDYSTVPVILTSGYSHVLSQNGEHGFVLLHKPYSVEQLSRVLRKAIAWHNRKQTTGT